MELVLLSSLTIILNISSGEKPINATAVSSSILSSGTLFSVLWRHDPHLLANHTQPRETVDSQEQPGGDLQLGDK